MPRARKVPPLLGRALARRQVEAIQLAARGLAPGPDVEGGIELGPLLGVPPVVVTRPLDLLRLRFSFDNCRLRTVDGALVLERARANAQARILVDHQPQHLVEEAGREDSAGPHWPKRPVRTLLSTHTRIALSLGAVQVPWTLDGLLAACSTLPLVLAPNARIEPRLLNAGAELPWRGPLVGGVVGVLLDGVTVTSATAPAVARSVGTVARSLRATRVLEARVGPDAALAAFGGLQVAEVGEGIVSEVAEILARPSPAVPTAGQTSIELPWRLKLSPGPSGTFVHSTTPVQHEGRVELWHSRLGRRSGETVTESGAHVRVIWARDRALLADPLPPDTQELDQPTFLKSIGSTDRVRLMHETSDFSLKRSNGSRYVPPAVHVDNLMLSSLGGWLSSRFSTDDLPDGDFPVLEWQHLATQGRDHFVKLVKLGFLFPFGHRAVLVQITERQFRPDEPGNPAYLLLREFIQVLEPSRSFTSNHKYTDGRTYKDAADPAVRFLDKVMPFASVTVLTRTTPLLDQHTTPAGGKFPGFSGNDFVPYVGKRPFGFRILALDRLGNQVEYAGPLVFVTKPTNSDATGLAATIEAYYELTDPAVVAHELGGQLVGYAPDVFAGKPLATVLATQRLRWDAATDNDIMGNDDTRAGFAPMLRTASVVVPAVNALAGRADPITVRYPPHYAVGGLDAAAQVFLAVDGKPGLTFSDKADRSGGFVSPNLAITGLSGATGPVGGSIQSIVSGTAAPADFFGGLLDQAKLFGIVPISELISSFSPGDFPTFVADQVDRLGALREDLARIGALAAELPGRVDGLAAAGTAQAEALKSAAAAVGTAALPVLQALAPYVPGGPLAARAGDLAGALGTLDGALGASTFLPAGLRSDLSGVVRRLREQVADVGELVTLLEQVANGLALPETVSARLHWSTEFKPWPASGPAVFQPRPGKDQAPTAARATLDLAVEVQAPLKPSGTPTAIASCSLSPFALQLVGKEPFITLDVEKIEFLVQAGRKADVNVLFAGEQPIRFGGPLEFVNVLQTLIPFDGFSDPPHLEVTTAGIKAGFDLALPDVPIGILNLTQMSIGAEVNVPFLGESLDFRFSFCSRERPFHLTVWVFGGGGFFAVTVTPKECRILEAAFEFGACASIDFGVASGSIEVMAGIYFRLEKGNSELTGYFRLRGEVDVLGLISASLELYLELSYEIDTNTARGRAELTIEVEVLMFSTSVTIECEKKFQGSDKDPSFAAMLGPAPGDPVDISPWADYCAAFAAV